MPASLPHQPEAYLPPGAPEPVRTGLSVLNAGAVVVAGLYFGRELFVPLVLAVLLAFVLAPAVSLLQRARIGKAPSVLIAVALAFVVISSIGLVVGRQATMLAASLPSYSATIQDKMRSLTVGGELLGRLNASIHSLMGDAAEGVTGAGLGAAQTSVAVIPAPATAGLAGELDASSALLIVRTVVQPLFSPLATSASWWSSSSSCCFPERICGTGWSAWSAGRTCTARSWR